MSHRAVAVAVAALLAACSTTADNDERALVSESAPDPRLPAWLQAPPGVARDPRLEEAAALLCARDTDAVIDDDARHAAGLVDGQVFGLLRKAASEHGARAALGRDAAALLSSSRATYAGSAIGASPTGEVCGALVYTRRLVDVARPPAASLPSGRALEVELRLPADKHATLYASKPDGFVVRWSLPRSAHGTQRVSVPAASGDGRYVLEVIVDAADGPADPEIALVWPWNVGAPRAAPFPEVLFPDEGHDDTALTHRAEALVQRLRNEQLIDPFKVSPALLDVATARAQAVAARGALGHRVRDARAVPAEGDQGGARDPREELRARFGQDPRAQFLRLAEVQAQGSTLADAWHALLDSPAHRYELTDTAFTHAGAAVARGQDAAGRATITVVVLLARRPPNRDPDATRATLLGAANVARAQRGLEPLLESSHLNRLATRLAGAMRDRRNVDDTLLGGPIAQVALEADASLGRVTPLVARNDDPLLLLASGPPALLMNIDTTQAGIGVALDVEEGTFYVVVLAGE
jgi:uncharacterized protein YkwD